MKNNRLDIMVDLETLGTQSNATIIQLSAIAFDITKSDHLAQINMCLDFTNNTSEIVATGSTLKWWLTQNRDTLNDIIRHGENYHNTSTSIITHFVKWVKELEEKYDTRAFLWGKSELFDNKIIQAHCEQFGLTYPIHYQNDRCVRTIVELASMKLGYEDSRRFEKDFYSGLEFEEHNALEDCKAQIKITRYCYDVLTKQD